MVLGDGSTLASYLLKRGLPPSTTTSIQMGTFLEYNILHDEFLKENIVKQRWNRSLLDYKIIVYKRRHGMGYLASRLTGTYAATYRVLKEILTRVPNFTPKTILDFGSGIGCTYWAVDSIWGREGKLFHSVDLSGSMLELAARIREEGGVELESVNDMRETKFLPGLGTYDLVVAAYSISDLPSLEMINKTLISLWNQTKHFLVLVEYGNAAGHSILAEFRKSIIEEESKKEDTESYNPVFAPCPHALKCPLMEEGCYFKQRTGLSTIQSRDALYLKKKQTRFSNEKFSYLILARPSVSQFVEQTQEFVRLVGPTLKRKRHVITQLCASGGEIEKRIFSKSKHSSVYKYIRKKSEWGDILQLTPNKNAKDETDFQTETIE